eukprot:CAMPEP_0201521730 /NCGR_PEP_ID=MMETSP0161_2-20130828/15854_1 /ASSEMBLY_ACC=CAM_ASM_000251 /TAXON_ID=180227 /ORGANISM="Neoparamoeba aestuarina, Strain SoJaBio B1-5/56/2" /LENGTH=390 /DNA_ID=CAMNT_0047920419 /DNA_START=45 /DNA_END=1217 /DNA_ORIENTATION=+
MAGTGTVQESLITAFKNADSGGSTRTIVAKVDVESEEIRFVADGKSSVSIQRDYGQLQTFADMHGPCFFLVKHAQKSWKIYTYCPDSEPVKTKMLYSTSKDTLLKAVGVDNFDFDLHTSTKEELSFKKIQDDVSAPRESALSNWEKEHNKVLRAEQQEASTRASNKKDGIGGYHPVSVPLEQSAKDLLTDFKTGSANFVELKISPGKDTVVGVRKENGIQLSNLKAKMNDQEPRYYFVSSGASKYMLYLCPANSKIEMRMVYSTAKPSVSEAAKACGIHLSRVVEASDVGDVDQALFTSSRASGAVAGRSYGSHSPQARTQEPEWLNSPVLKGGRPASARYASGGPLGATSPAASKQNNITQAHPTAQLLGGASPGGPKKKIVVPPSGAW